MRREIHGSSVTTPPVGRRLRLQRSRRSPFPARLTRRKITLSGSRDSPLTKRLLSQSNARRGKAGVSIEELAVGEARPQIAHDERCSAASPCGPCWMTAAPRPANTRSRPAGWTCPVKATGRLVPTAARFGHLKQHGSSIAARGCHRSNPGQCRQCRDLAPPRDRHALRMLASRPAPREMTGPERSRPVLQQRRDHAAPGIIRGR